MSDLNKKTILQFFQDENGDWSSGRLLKVVAMLLTCYLVIAITTFLPEAKLDMALKLTEGLLLVAGASEVIQKATNK